MAQHGRTIQETNEEWCPYLERELTAAESGIRSLRAEMTQMNAENIRLKLTNERLVQDLTTAWAATTDRQSGGSNGKSRTAEERSMTELITRVGSLEEAMQVETNSRHHQLESACARLEAKIVALGSLFHNHQERLRREQVGGLRNVADAVQAFVEPIRDALAENVEENERRGYTAEAQSGREEGARRDRLLLQLLQALGQQ